MACKLSADQVKLVFQAVHGSVIASANNGTNYDFKQTMRGIYDAIMSRSNDQAHALDLLQHMPKMLLLSYTSFDESKAQLKKSGLSLDEIDALDDSFYSDIKNVAKYIGLTDSTAEIAQEIIEESNPSTGVIPTETYSEIEQKDEQRKKAAAETKFSAKPSSALTTFNQEAQAYGGVDAKDNIPDPDPVKRAYYAVVRNINNLLQSKGSRNADNLKYGNQKGIFLRLVPASMVPFENLQESDKQYLSTDDEEGTPYRKTSADKMALRESHDVYMVFTDKQGNILYFDENGQISSKENGGHIAYGKMRNAYTNKAGEREVRNVQPVSRLVEKGEGSVEDVTKQRNQEMDILEKSREFLRENPDEHLLFSVSAGRNGYVTEDYSTKNTIGSLNLEQGFRPFVSTEDGVVLQKGGVYFTVPDYENPLLIKRPTFGQIEGLSEALAEVVFSDRFTNNEKSKIAKQFTFSNDTNVYEKDGNLIVKQNGEEVTDKQKFIDTLNGQTVNINKDLLNSTYSAPVMDKGEVKIQTKNYNNFIGANFYTSLATNAEGKIVSLNAYNSYFPTKEANAKIFSTPEVNPQESNPVITETPTDTPVDKFAEALKNIDFKLRKSVMLSSTATEEQIKAAQEWYENHPISKHVPFQAMFNIMNSNARAEFTTAGIALFQGSNYTDLYHEAFHAFTQIFLTKEQKADLYNEARKLSGSFKTADGRTVKFNAATDLQLEEFMAEDFRKYVLSDGTKIIAGRNVRNNIFSRIWNFLKSIFTGVSIADIASDWSAAKTIKDMYDKLYIGDVHDYQPSIKNVQFTVLNKGVETMHTGSENLNYQDSKTLIDSIDSLMAANLAKYGLSVSSIFTNPEVIAPLYDRIKYDLSQLKPADLNGQRIIDFALANWGSYDKVADGSETTGVLAYHKMRSQFITFDEKYAEMSPDERTEVQDENDPKGTEEPLALSNEQLQEQFGANVFERKGNELSVYELASKKTLYLIKSLQELDKNGKPILNALGVPKLADFTKIWSIVINSVQGATNRIQMYNRLIDTAKIYPEISTLIERLGNPELLTKKEDWPAFSTWQDFYKTFSVYRVAPMEMRVIYKVENGAGMDGVDIEFTESAPTFKQVENTFANQFQSQVGNRFVKSEAQGNVLDLKSVLATFPSSNMNVDESMAFLKAIGFYLTDNPSVRNAVGKHSQSVYWLHKNISDLAAKQQVISSPIATLRTSNSSQRVQEILNIEAAHSGKYANNSVLNVNGDKIYDLSLNNTITKMLAELNDQSKDYASIVAQPEMAHLDFYKNPKVKASIWLNSLFNIPVGQEVDLTNQNKRRPDSSKKGANDVRIEIVNLNGLKLVTDNSQYGQTAESGIQTNELDPKSKFLMDLHTMLMKGIMELPRHASKATSYGVYMTALYTAFNENARHLYISPGYFADKVKANNAITSLLLPKIAAEMERIAIVKEGLVDNIPGFNERGQKFTAFDDVLSKDVKEKLYKIANKDNSLAAIEADTELQEEISQDISKYFNALYKENMDLFEDLPYMSEKLLRGGKGVVGISSYINKDTGLHIGDTEKLKEVAMKAFTVNAFIHNLETEILYGDFAMYNHDKEDFHKRNANVGSTGRSLAADEGVYEFINNLGSKYAESIGAEHISFNGIVNTAIFKDAKVDSKYFNEYVDALVATKKYTKKEAEATLSAYKGMTEGDAQGWITFDAYRMMSILENSWSETQNELYHKIIDGEQVTAEDLKEFFPTKKFQYAGPLQTKMLHINATHKFSLVPLIPSLVKGTNMETIHNNMVRQGIHYGLFESGSKLATITKNGQPDSLYTGNDLNKREVDEWDGKPETAYTQNKVFIKYLKDQVDIASTWKNKTVFSTQLRKLIINDLFKKGIPINEKFGELVSRYETLLDKLQEQKKAELLEEAGWKIGADGKPTGSIDSLLNFVARELDRLEIPDHDIDFIRKSVGPNGTYRDLSYSLNAEKIESLLNSIVVKRLVRQKMNGEQLIQVSGAGFESRFRNASQDELARFGTNDLPTYRPGKGKDGTTTAMKVKIALKGDYYKLLNLTHTDGKVIGTRERLNEVIKNEAWLDKNDHRKMITMVGVRIPVQGFNSMEFMEVHEFLPEEAGSIIVPPAEIVAKSGSDFDIDKLTIFQPNIGSNKEGIPHYVTKGGTKATENEVISTIREILEHPDSFEALVRPNNTDLVTGVADELADKNIQGYNAKVNKVNETGSKISPTRILEPAYNLYKHESNNIGKKTLGIGAVDNSYSSIFKRIGARLNEAYTYVSGDDMHQQPIKIRMAHNTVKENGKEYISLSDIDTVAKQKVSDLISQLMNGWVDIEKDAWIFNINGNNIAGPVLLFLLEAGVDFRTAAYFVSQPLVVEYIKERYKAMSPFYQAAGQGELYNEAGSVIPKPLVNFGVRKKMMQKYAPSYIFQSKMGYDVLKRSAIYQAAQDFNGQGTFTADSLLKNIENKDKSSKQAIGALLHFFELEDLGKHLTNIKLKVNLDTAPSKSTFAAQKRISDIVDADQTVDAVSPTFVQDILTKTPIRSFNVQGFQLQLWTPIMKMRADHAINEFLIEKAGILQKSSNLKKETGFTDVEKFVAAFKNDMNLYLLHNYIKGIDVNNLKDYRGINVETSIPVKSVQLKYGAFVKEGKMYVDMDQIKSDFETKAFASKGYTDLGLYSLKNPATFSSSVDKNINLQEYTHFVLEREYLRYTTPIAEGQSRASYEESLAAKALENTFNFHYMLKSNNSIADKFLRIRATYPSLSANYAVMNALQYVNSSSRMVNGEITVEKGERSMRTLKFADERLDRDLLNTYHENLVNLADPTVMKVEGAVQNEDISKFFSRFMIAEYLRTGITKSNDSLARILETEKINRLIEQAAAEKFGNGISKEQLNEYYNLVKRNWKGTNPNRFRNYMQSTEKREEVIEQDSIFSGVTTDAQGLNVYYLDKTKPATTQTTAKTHPDTVFIYPTSVDNKADMIAKKMSDVNNTIAFIAADSVSKPWTDTTYDENVKHIDSGISVIESYFADGAEVAFPADGFTTAGGKNMKDTAPRTYSYMVTEFYKRLNYIQPGARVDLGFRQAYQFNQEVTDTEVDEFMRKCFE